MIKVLIISMVLGPGLTKTNIIICENHIVLQYDMGEMFKNFPSDDKKLEAIIDLATTISDLKNKTRISYNKSAEIIGETELKLIGKWTAYPPLTDFSKITKEKIYDSISIEKTLTHLAVPYIEVVTGSKYEYRSSLGIVDKYISEEQKKYIPSIYQYNENFPDHPFVLASGMQLSESHLKSHTLEVISIQEIDMTKKEFDLLLKGKLPFIGK